VVLSQWPQIISVIILKKVKKKEIHDIANILTRIFSPEVSVIIFSLIIYDRYVPKSIMSFVIWFGVTALFIVVSAIFIYALFRQKKISDLNITKREERPQFFFPILAGMIVITTLDYLVGWKEASECLAFVTFAYSIAFTITLFFKISIHVFSVTLVYLILIVIYNNFWMLLLFPIPIITAWTRVHLKKHSYQEVIAGFIAPFILILGWMFVRTNMTILP
jgi:hypothetical protein